MLGPGSRDDSCHPTCAPLPRTKIQWCSSVNGRSSKISCWLLLVTFDYFWMLPISSNVRWLGWELANSHHPKTADVLDGIVGLQLSSLDTGLEGRCTVLSCFQQMHKQTHAWRASIPSSQRSSLKAALVSTYVKIIEEIQDPHAQQPQRCGIQSHPVGICRPPATSCFTCTAVKFSEMVVTCHLLILNFNLALPENRVPQMSIVYHHVPH